MKEKFEKGQLDIAFCKGMGLEIFDLKRFEFEKKIKVERLACINQYKDKTNGISIWIKEIDLMEGYIIQTANFFRERTILRKIKGENNPYLPQLLGEYYSLEGNLNIRSLLLAMDLGDLDLREKMFCEGFSNYDIIIFLKHMVSALKNLKKLGIFHGDINPRNIIYSREKKIYKLINFGYSASKESLSSEMESTKSIHKVCMKDYASPIKRNYLQNLVDVMFNPFKDDIFSLGICLGELIETAKEKSETLNDLKLLYLMMTKDDERDRIDIETLITYVNKFENALSEDPVSSYKKQKINKFVISGIRLKN